MKFPRAILFDLDDTILVAFGPAQSQWQRTIAAFADRLGPIEATVIAAAIQGLRPNCGPIRRGTFLEEKGCVSWDISAAPRRSGREYYGNEPK